jgi:hypothetical protein
MLLRLAAFDVLRCLAFLGIVAGLAMIVQRLTRGRPTLRAALPRARIGGGRGSAAFARRALPFALVLAGLASLGALNRMSHRVLMVTERAGMLHAERLELVGTAPDKNLDDGDVWIVNRAPRAIACKHLPFDKLLWGSPMANDAFVIEPGQALAVDRMPQFIGPSQEPAEMDGETLWLTWAR